MDTGYFIGYNFGWIVGIVAFAVVAISGLKD